MDPWTTLWYQKGTTNLDFTEAKDSGWQWHQLGRMQVCITLQTINHASTPPLSFYRPESMPFLPPNQQRQSTEGIIMTNNILNLVFELQSTFWQFQTVTV